MTDSIDQALHLLGTVGLPVQPGDIERAVMARIEAATRAREARPSLGVGVGAAAIAMVIGVVSTNVMPVADKIPVELSVFSANAAFAPATLLATQG